jgi:hypothetical protein
MWRPHSHPVFGRVWMPSISRAIRCCSPTATRSLNWRRAQGSQRSASTRCGRGRLLMSYSSDPIDGIRHAVLYAAKILAGAKPADLSVEQASRFTFAINLKTAEALGIEIPTTVLLLADETIDDRIGAPGKLVRSSRWGQPARPCWARKVGSWHFSDEPVARTSFRSCGSSGRSPDIANPARLTPNGLRQSTLASGSSSCGSLRGLTEGVATVETKEL